MELYRIALLAPVMVSKNVFQMHHHRSLQTITILAQIAENITYSTD